MAKSSSVGNAINSGITTATSLFGLFSAIPGINILAGIAGALIGFGFSANAHNEEQIKLINSIKNERMVVTQKRNTAIKNIQSYYKNTRSSFDNKYGTGMFDRLDTSMNKVLNWTDSGKNMKDIFDALEFDKVSGEISTRLVGTGDNQMTEEEYMDFMTSTFSLTDFNAEYLNYIEEELRRADSAFGLEMERLSEMERSAIEGYESDVNAINVQLAQQFQAAFMSRRQEQVSEEMSSGQVSVAQSTSGIRQKGSGINQSIIQEYQEDLSKAAYASALNYLVVGMDLSIQQASDNLMQSIYSTRNSIAIGTKQTLNALEQDLRQNLETQQQAAGSITDMEEAIDTYNETIEDINNDMFFNHREEVTEEIDSDNMFYTGDIF